MAEPTVELEREPLKLFIKDLHKVEFDSSNKYLVHLYGMKFKNVRIHGTITDIMTVENRIICFELTDASGCVNIMHNRAKNSKMSIEKWKSLRKIEQKYSQNSVVMWMKSKIDSLVLYKVFKVGDVVSVIGDIYIDDITKKNCVSAFEVNESSVTMDIFWMHDLMNLYRNVYKTSS